MTFSLGLMIGGLCGLTFGALMMGIYTAGKISDMQEALDAWEATRWHQ